MAEHKGFFDMPVEEPDPFTSSPAEDYARAMEEKRQAEEEKKKAEEMADRVETMKHNILCMLDEGHPPQSVLYAALACIGSATGDKDFTETAQGKLNDVYADLQQLSFLQDNEAIARQRLRQMETAYNDRLRRNITRQLSGYRRIAQALDDVLRSIDCTEEAMNDTAENAPRKCP